MTLMTPRDFGAQRDLKRVSPRRDMSAYRSLLVYAGWAPSAQSLIKCAATLANRFGASLRGVTTPALVQTPIGRGFEDEQATLEACVATSMALVGERFGDLTALVVNGTDWTWRRTAPVDALAMEAHCADLLVVNPSYVWPGKAISFPDFAPTLKLGRPVLVLPWGCERLDARVVAVSWNESPQCRRAMHDAMPFLTRAERVVLQQVSGQGGCGAGFGRLREIERWLHSRGVNATSQPIPSRSRRTAGLIIDAAAEIGADLIVAGAYGHGALHRALLGSTTEALLRSSSTALLMSR